MYFFEDNDGRKKYLPKTKCPNLVIFLNQKFSTRGSFVPQGILGNAQTHFLIVTNGRRRFWHPVGRGQ